MNKYKEKQLNLNTIQIMEVIGKVCHLINKYHQENKIVYLTLLNKKQSSIIHLWN